MKIVTVKLPKEYIDSLEVLVKMDRQQCLRSERIRYIARAMIHNELWLTEELLSKEGLMKHNLKLYNYCIFCGMMLFNPIEPYKYKKYNITEFRACCHCLKKYKGKSMEELPEKIRKNVDKILKTFFGTI